MNDLLNQRILQEEDLRSPLFILRSVEWIHHRCVLLGPIWAHNLWIIIQSTVISYVILSYVMLYILIDPILQHNMLLLFPTEYAGSCLALNRVYLCSYREHMVRCAVLILLVPTQTPYGCIWFGCSCCCCC